MPSLLATSRTRISILPPELIVEAAVEGHLTVDDLVAGVDGDTVLFRPDVGARVLAAAYSKWTNLAVIVPRLDFDLQHQKKGNWCWAAVTASLLHFYCPHHTYKQCEVVDDNLGTHCCAGDPSSSCDKAYALKKALVKADMLFERDEGTVLIGVIADDIDDRFPIGLRIKWVDTKRGHFIVIDGYLLRGTGDFVSISDPWYGHSDLPLKALTDGNYQLGTHGGATWTHTYRTKPPKVCQNLRVPAVVLRLLIVALGDRPGEDY